MARLRDYFSQRNGGPDDTERDESPPEANQAAREETAEPKHSDVPSSPEESSKSESCRFVSEILETCGEPLDVGNESDWRNPVQATLHAGDLSYRHTERRHTRCSVTSDASGSNNGEVQERVIQSRESNHEYLLSNSLPMEKEERGLSVYDISDHAETPDPDEIIQSDHRQTNPSEFPKVILGDAVAHPHAASVLNTDLLNPQKPAASVRLQGEAQEDNLTRDPKLPERTCTQTEAHGDETLPDSETRKVASSFTLSRPPGSVSERVGDADDCGLVHESKKEDGVCEKATISTTVEAAVSEEGNAFEALRHLNPKHGDNSATEETEMISVSSCDIVEEKDVATPLETNNVEEGSKVASNSPEEETKHVAEEEIIGEEAGDMFVELGDVERREIEAVEKQGDSCLADTAEVNWEMMVEEEEKSTSTDEEESEARRSQTVGRDEGRLGDAEALESKEAGKEDKTVWEREKNEEEDGDVSEGRLKIGAEIGEIMAGKDREEVAKELQYVHAANEAGEEDLAQDIEEEEREKRKESELEEENHAAEIHEVDIENTDVQNEEDVEEEDDTEIDLSDDDEAGVEWEDQVDVEEENPDYEEEECFGESEIGDAESDIEDEESEIVDAESEIVDAELEIEDEESETVDAESEIEDEESEIVDAESETVDAESEIEDEESEIVDAESEIEDEESEIVGAESESMTVEDGRNKAGCFEVRSDITQNKVGEALSALDKRVIYRENGYIPNEMHLYEEEDFQSEEIVPRELPKVPGDGGSLVFAYEPENDPASHDSASAESDSDDEVELYMHCLRAVHLGGDRNKDTASGEGKSRPSGGRGKLLTAPMPSISESQDEEHFPGHLLDTPEDMETADVQPTAAASNGQESTESGVSRWKETFSCSNISQTLLYGILLVVFLVVAHRYDFLACFGLYLISVVCLYCQGERQPKQPRKQHDRLN